MNKKLKHGLSVVIPALNEEKFIGKTILKTVHVHERADITFILGHATVYTYGRWAVGWEGLRQLLRGGVSPRCEELG